MPSSVPDAPAFRPGVWAAAVALGGAVLALALAPPFVGPGTRAGLMQAFQLVCHQLPDRSFAVGGVPLAVCHRCTGIFAGFVLGGLAAPLAVRPLLRLAPKRSASFDRILLVASLVPLALDWGLGAVGLWANTPASRLATGLLFGLAAGLVAVRALSAGPRPEAEAAVPASGRQSAPSS